MPILGHYMAFNRANLLGVTTEEGVYELYGDGETLYFGWSEDDLLGIRGRLECHLSGELEPGGEEATHFRFEINTRPEAHIEDLLTEFEHEHGVLPKYNASSATEAKSA